MAIMLVGMAVALSIYITFGLFKRPISLERSGEIGGIVGGLVGIVPPLMPIIIAPLVILSLPLAVVAWMLHPAWLPSFFDTTTTLFSVPVFVWFGVIILVYWIGASLLWLLKYLERK
jgi:hypothetical protein